MAVGILGLFSFSAAHWVAESPVVARLLYLTGIAVAGFGAAGRAWANSYIAGQKLKQLVTTGPYSLCRNPLYFFSMILAVGIALCSRTFTAPLVVATVLAILYHVQIRQEEQRLAHRFGEEFQSYRTTIPRFFPSLQNYREPDEICISPRVLKRGLFGVAFLLILIGALDLLQGLHQSGYLPVFFQIY
jgi:protein-S-isoprenylcysteine O-methyltransferase Ste14